MEESLKIEEVIATRNLTFTRDGAAEPVTVTILAPVQSGDNDWSCPYSIQAASFSKSFRMFGVDSMQALIHTVHIISAELDALSRKHGGTFQHLDDSNTGFPAPELSQTK